MKSTSNAINSITGTFAPKITRAILERESIVRDIRSLSGRDDAVACPSEATLAAIDADYNVVCTITTGNKIQHYVITSKTGAIDKFTCESVAIQLKSMSITLDVDFTDVTLSGVPSGSISGTYNITGTVTAGTILTDAAVSCKDLKVTMTALNYLTTKTFSISAVGACTVSTQTITKEHLIDNKVTCTAG